MPVVAALGKLRQEDHQKFKAYLVHRNKMKDMTG